MTEYEFTVRVDRSTLAAIKRGRAVRLVLDGDPRPSLSRNPGRGGAVGSLIRSGLLVPGTVLVWDRPRVMQRHEATVLDDGYLEAYGERYGSLTALSVGLTGVVGSESWTAWKLPDGRTLADLRKEMPR